jgi:hypothetical protein
MKITVERFVSDDDSTLGALFVDDRFECFTVEDEFREIKVPAETRIPAGRYSVTLRTHGGFHARYGRKFSAFHRGMLEVLKVPNFTDILFHAGNTEKDTAGCLLVNAGVYARRGEMSGQASVDAYKRFYKKVVEAAANDDLDLFIIDRDKGF